MVKELTISYRSIRKINSEYSLDSHKSLLEHPPSSDTFDFIDSNNSDSKGNASVQPLTVKALSSSELLLLLRKGRLLESTLSPSIVLWLVVILSLWSIQNASGVNQYLFSLLLPQTLQIYRLSLFHLLTVNNTQPCPTRK